MVEHESCAPVVAPLSPDLEKYRALLDSIELTDEQADALLLEIWGFMLKCVEAQFTVPSISNIFSQLLIDQCEPSVKPLECEKEDLGET